MSMTRRSKTASVLAVSAGAWSGSPIPWASSSRARTRPRTRSTPSLTRCVENYWKNLLRLSLRRFWSPIMDFVEFNEDFDPSPSC